MKRFTKTMRKTFSIFFPVLIGTLSLPAPYADALCVKEKKANLRKGPGLAYQKLWQVFQYMPFKLLGQKGNWLRVKDVDGDVYWMHKKLATTQYKCAVVKQNETNLRQGPGTKYPPVPWSPMDKYFSMKVLQSKGNWIKVEDSVGDQAWVYAPLVWIQ